MTTHVVDLCHRPTTPFKRMNIASRALCAAFALIGILVVAPPVSAATLLVDANGELIGATGVDVQGALYDVAFVDGTCAALFSGCDELSDFTFTTGISATAASQALLDQVFLGNFDTDPALTFGCSDAAHCIASTPYAITAVGSSPILLSVAVNFAGAIVDVAAWSGTDPSLINFADFSTYVYADWTPAAATAPEPASLLLLGTGLLGVGVRRWRQKRR